jgi:choice-of-anchor A domain-containing protein
VVINIAGISGTFTSGSGWSVVGGSSQNVLVNYYQASSLILGTSGITASLLAPFADPRAPPRRPACSYSRAD